MVNDDSRDVVYHKISDDQREVRAKDDLVIIKFADAGLGENIGDVNGWYTVFQRKEGDRPEGYFVGSDVGENRLTRSECSDTYNPWLGDGGAKYAQVTKHKRNEIGIVNTRGWQPVTFDEENGAYDPMIVREDDYIPMCLVANRLGQVLHMALRCGVVGRDSYDTIAHNCPTPSIGGTSGGGLSFEHRFFGSTLMGIHARASCPDLVDEELNRCLNRPIRFNGENYNIAVYLDVLPLEAILGRSPVKY